ncbi:hypothetical protein KSP39_PZI009551 [Platanthera zijinensis]|uniref:ZW10 C-terminal helical domain-containing protein n=1 Tax=Platanthera zijinensis TaxID=2320716 RepID=A0AAP0G845_9ASPA
MSSALPVALQYFSRSPFSRGFVRGTKLIHMALENISPLFQSVSEEVGEKDKLMKENPLSFLDELIPSLRKLWRLADLVDMALKSIKTIWESGELVKYGFTTSEVTHFMVGFYAHEKGR